MKWDEMKKIYLVILLFLVAAFANAQELTGIWRGHFSSNSSLKRMNDNSDRSRIEVQIAQRGNTFQAVTYSYQGSYFYGKAEADGTVNPNTKKVLLRELKLVDVRMTAGGDVYSMNYFLRYSKLGDEEFLEGTYTSMNIRDSSKGEGGIVFLHKVPTSDFSKEPFLEKREKEIEREKHKTVISPAPPSPKNNDAKNAIAKQPVKKPAVTKIDSGAKKPSSVAKNNTAKNNNAKRPVSKLAPKTALAKTDKPKEIIAPIKTDSIVNIEKKPAPELIAPKVLTSRQNELVKTITVNTNEVELRIYDDGVIDNDTVSVYVDKKNVIYHAMLTDKPIIVKLHLDETNDYHEVVMVAENEGLFPPNTSLMVVQAGDKQYEVRIVSTEQKNATVVFKFEKSK